MKQVNKTGRVLCALMLSAGLAVVGCTKGTNDIAYDSIPSSATDLSSVASANCYIISSAGLYKFKSVKGNSSEPVGDVASASILWETFGTSEVPECGDLIKSCSCKDGYIAFQTADSFRKGNAVIAAKDSDGTILWSWHIWLTDQPQGQVYYNNAGTMMDRNLGATSVIPGDVGALGLLYQWGRKDPFLGSSSIDETIVAASTITWPSHVYSYANTGTIDYATANPTTFLTHNSKNGDWYHPDPSPTDEARWTTSDKKKSIYDPCPVGWRVPDGGDNGVWAKAFDSSSTYYEYPYDFVREGMNFSDWLGSDSVIWYPSTGYLDNTNGKLCFANCYGLCWSATPYNSDAYSFYFYYIGKITPSRIYDRSYGHSVRCVQE